MLFEIMFYKRISSSLRLAVNVLLSEFCQSNCCIDADEASAVSLGFGAERDAIRVGVRTAGSWAAAELATRVQDWHFEESWGGSVQKPERHCQRSRTAVAGRGLEQLTRKGGNILRSINAVSCEANEHQRTDSSELCRLMWDDDVLEPLPFSFAFCLKHDQSFFKVVFNFSSLEIFCTNGKIFFPENPWIREEQFPTFPLVNPFDVISFLELTSSYFHPSSLERRHLWPLQPCMSLQFWMPDLCHWNRKETFSPLKGNRPQRKLAGLVLLSTHHQGRGSGTP